MAIRYPFTAVLNRGSLWHKSRTGLGLGDMISVRHRNSYVSVPWHKMQRLDYLHVISNIFLVIPVLKWQHEEKRNSPKQEKKKLPLSLYAPSVHSQVDVLTLLIRSVPLSPDFFFSVSTQELVLLSGTGNGLMVSTELSNYQAWTLYYCWMKTELFLTFRFQRDFADTPVRRKLFLLAAGVFHSDTQNIWQNQVYGVELHFTITIYANYEMWNIMLGKNARGK